MVLVGVPAGRPGLTARPQLRVLGAVAVSVPDGEVTTSGMALGAGAQLKAAELLAFERRALEGVVLLARVQVPEQHGKLARDGDDRDLGPAACADALVRRASGSGC